LLEGQDSLLQILDEIDFRIKFFLKRLHLLLVPRGGCLRGLLLDVRDMAGVLLVVWVVMHFLLWFTAVATLLFELCAYKSR